MNNSHPYYDDYGFYVEQNDEKVNYCEGIIASNDGGTAYCIRTDTHLVGAIDGAVYLCEDCAKNEINLAYSALNTL